MCFTKEDMGRPNAVCLQAECLINVRSVAVAVHNLLLAALIEWLGSSCVCTAYYPGYELGYL
jgi:hypothetical protein